MMQETFAWARTKSSFYRRHFAGLSEREFHSLGDLQRIPFITAEDIAQNPLHFLCVSQGEINRVVTLQTSGTTGMPKRIYFTREDQELTVDFFHWAMSTMVGPGWRVLMLLPGELPGSVGDLLAAALKRLGADGVPHGLVREPCQTLDVMESERIDALVGIPVQVLALARHSKGRAAPRRVLLSVDHVPESIKEELHSIWGCEVYTHYGMTEMGFGGGMECEGRNGYHLREADLYFEIVDPETGNAVPDGEPGEVVFTTLTRRGMPLIRYRTGDISRFVAEPCPCGTVLKTLERIKNRLGSFRPIGKGGSLSLADLDEAIFRVDPVLDFGATLSREQGLDRLRIEVQVAGPGNQQISAAIHEALNSVPVIRSALGGGGLAVDVCLLAEGQAVARKSAKRLLADLRE